MAIGNSPPLFPSSILDTFRPGGPIFWCRTFLAFYTVHEVLTASILGWFAIPSSSGSRLAELFAMTSLSWVALHGIAYSFIQLHKPLHHDKAVIFERGVGKIKNINQTYANLMKCFQKMFSGETP